MKRISIVGGGLAGFSLGIGLRRHGIPVVLSEAGTYPRHRVCGEFISGLDPATLEALGLTGILEGAVSHRSTVWYRREKEVFSADLPEIALGLSRYVLDARCKERFLALGGDLRQCSRICSTGKDTAGQVWATGRTAAKRSPWLGLKAHFTDVATTHGLEMHLGDQLYVGLTRVAPDRVNVCALVRGPLEKRTSRPEWMVDIFRQRGLASFADRLDAATMDEDSVVGVSALPFGRWAGERVRGEPGCRLGDAHRQIPPFTGNGMTMAIQSAESALPHLRTYASGACAWPSAVEQIRRALARRFDKRLRLAGLIHPFLTHPWGQSMLSLGRGLPGRPFDLLYHALR